MKCTVLGGHGYIGRHLAAHLHQLGHEVFVPKRNDERIFSTSLGTVFYCVGLTADFRQRPVETIEAHVSLLQRLLQGAAFDRLVYLSSTRVYLGNSNTHEEAALTVQPYRADDLYKLSKLMGESLALHSGQPCTVVRLSNVVGGTGNPESFVYSLWRAAHDQGYILLHSHPDTAKDYIHIDDVVQLLPSIAWQGQHRIYNMASGMQIAHSQWLERICTRTGAHYEVAPGAELIDFAAIDNARIVKEFEYQPRPVLNILETDYIYQKKDNP